MKIKNPTSIPDARPVTPKPAADAESRTAAQMKGTSRADKVSLERNQRIAVTASLAQEKEVRSARMKMLEIAVRNGTYKPDAGLIAERMLDSSAFLESVDEDLEHGEPPAAHAEVTP